MLARLNTVVVLRHNTQVGGDVRLACREFDALIGAAGAPLSSRAALQRLPLPGSICRGVQLGGTSVVALDYRSVPANRVTALLQRSAFAQEVFVWGFDRTKVEKVLKGLVVPAVAVNATEPFAIVAFSQAYVLESEGVVNGGSAHRLQRTIELLSEPYQGGSSTESQKVRRAKKTTLSLSHDLHIYKAKFFPRMVRALLNIFAGKEQALVVDPYCGSGTALLEGALLGHRCVGVDLDPICALISRAKVAPFLRSDLVLPQLERFLATVERSTRTDTDEFPAELGAKLRRRDRIDKTDFLPEITWQSATVAEAVSGINRNALASDLVKTIASDAVTKKVRFRFVGVGNGRYTIEILKQPLLSRLKEKVERSEELCNVFPAIAPTFGGPLGTVQVALGDARNPATWPVQEPIDVIVTSPPYLPASSGREHYAASRALAFYVLGMRPGEHGYYDDSVHEAADFLPLDDLPESKRLMDYLVSDASETADPQRDAMRFQRKAVPTHGYLTDMKKFFGGASASLSQNGVLLLVVAHHHVFYSHRRSEIEHVVSCRSLYQEIAETSGLYLHEEIEMELVKSAVSHARPMAKDDYFESVLVFRRKRPSQAPARSRSLERPRWTTKGQTVGAVLAHG